MTFAQKEGSGGGVEEPRWPYRTAGSGVGRGRRTWRWVRESGRNAAISKLQVTSQTFPQETPAPARPQLPYPPPPGSQSTLIQGKYKRSRNTANSSPEGEKVSWPVLKASAEPRNKGPLRRGVGACRRSSSRFLSVGECIECNH